MSAASLIKYLHLAYLAKPAANRIIFRHIRKSRASQLVCVGLGSGQVARHMIQVAVTQAPRRRMRFVGIDQFESRPAGSPVLSLKSAYQLLSPLGARVQLIPGDPWSALARSANTLLDTDLLVIDAHQDAQSLAQAWFYVPRMLHDQSLVLLETLGPDGAESTFRVLDLAAVRKLAAHATPRRQAA